MLSPEQKRELLLRELVRKFLTPDDLVLYVFAERRSTLKCSSTMGQTTRFLRCEKYSRSAEKSIMGLTAMYAC